MSRASDFEELLTRGRDGEQTESKAVRYHSWSPNNIRTIVVSADTAMIEHYVTTSTSPYLVDMINLTSADTSKKGIFTDLVKRGRTHLYSALEEIVFLVDAKYWNGAFRQDFESLKPVFEKDPDFMTVHPRFFGITVLKVEGTGLTEALLKLMRQQIFQARRDNVNILHSHILSYFRYSNGRLRMDTELSKGCQLWEQYTMELEYGVTHTEDRQWWRGGLRDDTDEDVKDTDFVRILRSKYYDIDATPSNKLGLTSYPLFDAFKSIAKPFLDELAKREEADKAAEAEAKAKDSAKQKLEQDMKADKEYFAQHAMDYIGLLNGLLHCQRLRKKIYDLDYQLMQIRGKLGNSERADGLSAKDITSSVTGAIEFNKCFVAAYNMSPYKGHKFGEFMSVFGTLASGYFEEVTRNVAPDVSEVARLLRCGLYDYCHVAVAFGANDSLSKAQSMLNPADEEAKTRVWGYLKTVYSGATPVKEVLKERGKKVSREVFNKFLEALVRGEILSAYTCFVKNMSLWDNGATLNRAILQELCRGYGFDLVNSRKPIKYNTEYITAMSPLLKNCADWEQRFKNLPCTWFTNNRFYTNLAEAFEHITTVYNLTNNLLTNILE